MIFETIPKEAYAGLGAIFGAVTALAGTLIAQLFARSIEKERIHGARFQQIATDFSAAAHALLWITWPATQNALTEEMIKKYHDEIHVLLPKIVGGHIAISAIDERLASLTSKLVDRIHEIDERIAEACLLWGKDQSACNNALVAAHSDALEVDRIVYKQIADVIQLRKGKVLRVLRGCYAKRSTT